jgi:hypothetical protein
LVLKVSIRKIDLSLRSSENGDIINCRSIKRDNDA